MPRPSVAADIPEEDGEVVQITVSDDDVEEVDFVEEGYVQREADRDHDAPRRFRRRLERFKGVADSEVFGGSMDDESELRLQLMLLREENARLKSSRHQPASHGTVIDRVRVLSTPATEAETLDDAWALLGECLAIREGLDQACLEIQAAMDSARDRLTEIATKVQSAMPTGESGGDGSGPFSR